MQIRARRLIRMAAVVAAVGVASFAAQAQVADPSDGANKQASLGPVRIAGGIMAGRLISRKFPVYPPEAKAAHIGGPVILHAVIARDGTIRNLQVVSGPDILRQGAIDAVSQWVYQPYLLNGEPTEVDTTITVNFNLGPSDRPGDPIPPAAQTDQASAQSPPGIVGLKPLGPARVSGGVMAGHILTKVMPVYPVEAKKNHVSGSVVMRALIGKEGDIESLEAISGPPMLKDAALRAVKQWTYQPYLLNGEPTEVDTTIVVNFNLGSPPPESDPGTAPN